ncbi:hypothetical protein O181_018565 [Austropuccinia psidii MF-1]|uniref:Uncharacterized protein n=1 Tax=Austropuccinia psidii MF-1 TaxID=1389203 RepID=A0A9Q3C8Z1_9BASI|nr:hypothetical protein [Austropuccinia psidii MF-1]
MSMSLKAKTLINTIQNLWLITPYGASQKFGILILHFPLPCLLSNMILSLHFLLIISAILPGVNSHAAFSSSPQMTCLLLPKEWLPRHSHIPSLCFCTTAYHAYATEPPSHALNLPSLCSHNDLLFISPI